MADDDGDDGEASYDIIEEIDELELSPQDRKELDFIEAASENRLPENIFAL